MKLTDIKNGNLSAEWAEKGYELPKFDVEAVKAKTHAEPVSYTHLTRDHVFHKSISSCYLEAFVLFAAIAHGP